MKRIPCESDLRSTKSETWAIAVMQCKTGDPYCGADGYCRIGGDCFIDQDMTKEQALQEIMHMQKELDDARSKCNRIEAKHSTLIARLSVEKDMAVKDGKSERAFILRRCIHILEMA